MKIQPTSKRRQGGMAVIVMLALLSIMLIWIGASMRSLNRLDRELKLLDQRQTRRLAAMNTTNPPANNQPATTVHP